MRVTIRKRQALQRALSEFRDGALLGLSGAARPTAGTRAFRKGYAYGVVIYLRAHLHGGAA